MARELLCVEDVLRLDEALIEAYRMHRDLRVRHPVAQRISRPGIPAILSESLIVHGASKLLGAVAGVEPGPNGVDLLVRLRDSRSILVEVKACGVQRWQEIKARDLASDVLIWVDFGRRYEDGIGALEVHVLREPHRCDGLLRGKPGLSQFLAAAGGFADFSTRRFANPAAVLRDD